MKSRGYLGFVFVLAGFSLAAQAQSQGPRYPETKQEPIEESFFGISVVDPYRWMETPNAPDFAEWLQHQDAFTSQTLNRIPNLDALHRRVAEHGKGTGSIRNLRKAGDSLFYLKADEATGQSNLYWQSRSSHPETPTEWSEPRRLDLPGGAGLGFEPAPSGNRLALKQPAGEQGAPVIVVVQRIDGTVVRKFSEKFVDFRWMDDKLALSKQDGSWQLHAVEEKPGSETILLGPGVEGCPDLTNVVATKLEYSPHSPFLVALIAGSGDSYYSLFVADLRKLEQGQLVWRQLADPSSQIEGAVPHGHSVYALSTGNPAGRSVLEFTIQPGGVESRVAVPPESAVIERFVAARDGLYLLTMDELHHGLIRMDWATKQLTAIELPWNGSIRGPLASPHDEHVLVGLETWDQPVTWFEVGGEPERLPCNSAHPTERRGVTTRVELAQTAEGASIPISLVHAAGQPPQGSLVWVMAYGGYGIPQTPRYLGGLKTFLEDGGIYAVAHVRGGGELGTTWHEAGRGNLKSNTYRDLIACVEHLIQRGIATPGRIAVEGASGGGPVVGMLAMHRPDLVRVVFDKVGDNNTLRLHVTPDGPYMIEEWGSPETEDGFRSLLAMDVTWHVRPGVEYPAFYLTAGGQDTSVPPWMPGKLAAHLQRHSPRHPVLLRVDHAGGHIADPDTANRQLAEQLAFLYWQTNHPDYQPASGDGSGK